LAKRSSRPSTTWRLSSIPSLPTRSSASRNSRLFLVSTLTGGRWNGKFLILTPNLQPYIVTGKIITFAFHFRFSLFKSESESEKSEKSLFKSENESEKSEKITFPLFQKKS
jgi:hypothetical protein